MIGASAHGVVSGAVRVAHDNGVFRHLRAGNGGNHLGTIFCDTFMLVLFSDHKAYDVLEKHEGDLSLFADLDEVSGFQRALGEEYAVVCYYAYRVAVDSCKSADDRFAVICLKLIKLAVVYDTGEDLSNWKVLLRIVRNKSGDLPYVKTGRGVARESL